MYPIETPINSLQGFLKTGSINQSDIRFIEIVLNKFPFFAVPVFTLKIDRIFRVTINNRIFDGEQKRIHDLKFLRNPDKSLVKRMGRANFVNQTVLYGGFEPMTILNELKPNVEDLITVTEWKLNTDAYVDVAPIFKEIGKFDNNELSMRLQVNYINSSRHLSKENLEQREILLTFLSGCFAKQVGKSDTDYYLSAYFANKILNEFEDGSIDVILYPSVQMDGSFMNIAMDSEFFRNNYVVKKIEESKVMTANHDKRQYMLEGTAWTDKVVGEKIIW